MKKKNIIQAGYSQRRTEEGKGRNKHRMGEGLNESGARSDIKQVKAKN